ncbi:MAG: hypothetical protein FWD78_05815 [Treponema sp.]|nr:hypothetical protein [Treponema sp.]
MGSDLAPAGQFAAGENVRVGVSWPDPDLDDFWDLWVIDTITGRIADNGGTVDITNRSFIMPAGTVILSITYKLNPNYLHQISVDENITNGTIAPKAAVTGDASLLQATSTVDTVYLDIQPLPGYQLNPATLMYNPGGVPISVPDTGVRPSFVMPTDDITVTGKFEKKDLNVTAPALSGGKISFLNNQSKTTAKLDDPVYFTVTADTGYRIKPNSVKYSYNNGRDRTITLKDPAVLGDLYSFPMPAYDVTVTAQFDLLYTVNLSNNDTIGTVLITNTARSETRSFIAGERVNVSVTVKDPLYLLDRIYVSKTYENITNADITAAGIFNMPADAATVTVTYMLNPDNLYKVSVTGTDNGTITAMSTPAGNTPITESKANYPAAPALVYLDLQPDPGYAPTSLAYNDGTNHTITPIPASGRASFPMPSRAVTVSGTFDRKDLDVTASALTGGIIKFSNNQTQIKAKLGDTVTFTVNENTGNRLRAGSVKYSYNGTESTPSQTGANYSFPMPAYDVTVTAQFDLLYTVNLSNNDTIGTVSVTNTSGASPGVFIAGETVNVGVNVTDAQYILGNITVTNTSNNSQVSISGGRFTMPPGNVNVTVTYGANTEYLFSVSVGQLSNGAIQLYDTETGGNIISSAKADTMVYLDLQPDLGYTPVSLKYNDGTDHFITPIPAAGRTSFQMPAHSAIVSGTFDRKNLNVTAPALPGGTIKFSNDQTQTTAKMGDTVTFTVTADANYRLSAGSVKYSYNGSGSIPNQSGVNYSFPMPAYDVTITAVFIPLYTVTITNDDPTIGTVSVTNTSGASPGIFIAGERVNVSVNITNSLYLYTIIVSNIDNGNITNTGYFNMPAANVTVTVTYKLNPDNLYKISVAKTNNGVITAMSTPANNTPITESKANPVVVYLELQPDPGYYTTSLTYNDGSDHDITPIPASGRASFVMPPRAVTVSGTFDRKNLNVTASSAILGGKINYSNNQTQTTAKLGDSVTFTVIPASGYRLRAGSVVYSYNGINSTPNLTGTTYSFSMPAYDVTVTAAFDPLYTIKETNDAAKGTVLVTNTGGASPGEFIAGERVNVSVSVIDSAYIVSKISGDNGVGDITGGYFNMPAGITTITVTYAVNPNYLYQINTDYSARGNIDLYSALIGGSLISKAKAADWVYLEIQPTPGYVLTKLTYNDGSVHDITIPDSGRASFQMPPHSVTITGQYDPKGLSVKGLPNPVQAGDITPSKTETAQIDDDITVTVKANPNYRLNTGTVKYSYNGEDYDPALLSVSGSTYTFRFTMPGYDVTVSADFDAIYTVTKKVTPDDTAGVLNITNASGQASSFAAGETVKVNATAKTGYQLSSLSADGAAITTGSFIMPAWNVTVTADFTAPLYSIDTGSVTGNGFISASSVKGGDYKAIEGETVTLAIQNGPGYTLDTLTIKNGSQNLSCQLSSDKLSATFTMPARSVQVIAVFVKKAYIIQLVFPPPVYGTASVISPTGIAYYNDTVQIGVTVTQTPVNGFKTSLVYYLDGQGAQAVSIPLIGSNYQFKVPDFTSPGTIIKVEVKIEGAIFNLSYDPAMAGKFTFLTQFSNLPYDRYMSKVGARLVPNMGYCFAASGSTFYVNNQKQLISPTIVDGSQVFYFDMPAYDVVVKADLNYCTYNLVASWEGVLDTSRAGSISVPSTAKYMDSITINAKINPGYTLQQIEFRDPVSNRVVKSISCNNAAAGSISYSVTLNQFNTNFNSVNGGQIKIVGIFSAIKYTLNLMTNPPAMAGFSITSYGTVPFDTPVTVTLRRMPTTRYKYGSFKLLKNYNIADKADPVYITSDEYSGTFKFYMPAYNAALYYEVEPIPSTNIVFNDPNMDSYIHFYADVSDGTPDETIYKEINSASPEQIVRLEVYKGDSPGGDNDIPINVKYWMLNDKSIEPLSAEDVMAVTIPAGSSGRTLGIMLEIDGVPHFRSIPIY